MIQITQAPEGSKQPLPVQRIYEALLINYLSETGMLPPDEMRDTCNAIWEEAVIAAEVETLRFTERVQQEYNFHKARKNQIQVYTFSDGKMLE